MDQREANFDRRSHFDPRINVGRFPIPYYRLNWRFAGQQVNHQYCKYFLLLYEQSTVDHLESIHYYTVYEQALVDCYSRS